MGNRFFSVITTVQNPTEAVLQLALGLHVIGATLIVIGDEKGPDTFDVNGVDFLSLDDQMSLPYELASKLPAGHYARKNVGYLAAISHGASCIYETDDDNAPLESWEMRTKTVRASQILGKSWVNVYRFFTNENIWPRGFPLDEITSTMDTTARVQLCEIEAPIQQGLVDNSPDVDAVWRLVDDRSFHFDYGESIQLQPGTWCPFNSQSTWWWPEAYSLMYLPSYCSFRMTDIWRSFIAQRCLWEMGYGVVYHAPEVLQERNEHDLMRDFKDEITGYTRNKEMVSTLETLNLQKGSAGVERNLLACYEALVKADFFPEKELELVRSWLGDVTSSRGKS